MGATSSHHEPLDRSKHGSSFKRSASVRQSKSKGNRSSPRRMDKLRRSFRDSFRRRKETISEASKPHLWQTDEMDVRAGTCFFHVKYLGCVQVHESRGMAVCEEALKVLKNGRRRPVKAILYVSGDGLRVVEDDTKGLIVDQTIEKVSFCAPDRNHDRGFSYICRDGTTRRWMCHGFLALKESGERLSHAVGCAFAVCLERKQKRDKDCSVTMNFDLSDGTFTRTGSFRQQSLTDKLQDTTNVNNNINALVTAAPSNTSNTIPATTVININNNISTNYNRKENIPIRTTPKISTHAIERPHATAIMLQRQSSFRGLSHLNHASPFKRQLSLRISDLPSNVERTRSHSLEYSFESRKPFSQFIHMKTPVSPIPELSPVHSNGSNIVTNVNNVTDQVSAMCQQLSEGLSLLSKSDDLLASKNNQLNSEHLLSSKDVFAEKVNDYSSQLIELQPVVHKPSYLIQKSCTGDSHKAEQSLLQNIGELIAQSMDANVINNNSAREELSNNSTLSQPMSTVSSVENIPLTPPATPPLAPNAQLPKPEQWLGKVAQLTMSVPESSSTPVSASPPTAKRTPSLSLHTRAYSLGSAETVLNRAVGCEKSSDPFNIDWASLAIESKSQNKNTNPFLSNSPCSSNTSDQAIKTFEVKM